MNTGTAIKMDERKQHVRAPLVAQFAGGRTERNKLLSNFSSGREADTVPIDP